jgi:hypothetical protein
MSLQIFRTHPRMKDETQTLIRHLGIPHFVSLGSAAKKNFRNAKSGMKRNFIKWRNAFLINEACF